jgi:cell division protein FtsI/penicillin-binding protein 2
MPKKTNNITKTDAFIKKRLTVCLVFGFLLLFSLILRMGWLQFIEGSELRERAYRQQVANRTIFPRRGNMYDATRKNSCS